MSTSTAPGRRVDRHRARPAADVACEQALPDFPPEVRALLQIWVDARRAEQIARDRLTDQVLRSTGSVRWWKIEKAARQLT